MASLVASPEANSDRQTDRQTEKATYRGSSYRSAQKMNLPRKFLKCKKQNIPNGIYSMKPTKPILSIQIWRNRSQFELSLAQLSRPANNSCHSGILSQCFQNFCPKISKIGHNWTKIYQNWSKKGKNNLSLVLKLQKVPNQSITSANSDNF